MSKILSIFFTVAVLLSCSPQDPNIQSLAGNWEFKLDPQNQGEIDGWMSSSFNDLIQLPGTTDEAGYGKATTDTAYGILSREFEYVGAAWYSRDIQIPEAWKGKSISLLLERVLWESTVYIDGKRLNSLDGLGTAHEHLLGQLSPGDHRLSIRVNNDMIHNIGDKGHAYGEYMQSIWNGIVGRIELSANDPVHIVGVKTFPNIETNQLTIAVSLNTAPVAPIEYELSWKEKKTNKVFHQQTISIGVQNSQHQIIPGKPARLWNEFDPFLYTLDLKKLESEDITSTTFGFHSVGKNKHHVLINGEAIFLRGNLDCIHFPNTGYPDMDKEGWMDIFSTYKDYGLNHVRFHSWCPPEAAFEAADELGIYIQAEASVWIDWWMGTDMIAKGRPEMNTKGHPQGIGQGDPDADLFIWEEMKRVVETYGNHPSFILFCIGNELGSSNFELMGSWIKELKEMDPRRLYAASTARTITEFCDYSATHNVPGVGGVRQYMTYHKNWDYEEKYSQCEVPIIAHEIGQWPVYPDWAEIEKYEGPLKPRNLEQLMVQAEQNSLIEMAEKYRMASGKLSALLYKDEIESFLRTPSCAGIQLLSMQDYIGQGEALIGWLDSFYEPKGNLSPAEAKQFLNEVVPLIKLKDHCYEAGMEFSAEALLHQYGPVDLKNQGIRWSLLEEGKTLISGEFEDSNYSKGRLHNIGNIAFTLPELDQAVQATLVIEVKNSSYTNSWPIWIFPATENKVREADKIVTELNPETLTKIKAGASVLFLANNSGDDQNVKLAAWKPLYWSASFFPGQSIETIGLLIDKKHSAFTSFPTEAFGSWNWYRIAEKAHGFDLGQLPKDFMPIAEPVSDFHYNRKLGSIFELKYGQGKILVCGYNLSPERDTIPEIKALRNSLLDYIDGASFNPAHEVSNAWISATFPSIEPAKTAQPKGFEEAILYVEAAVLQKSEGNLPWNVNNDQVLVNKDCSYKVSCDGTWKDDLGTAWFGKSIKIDIQVPSGSLGKVYLFLHDWSNQNRSGIIKIEKRKFSLEAHNQNGKWIELNYMREDSQDGQVEIDLSCLSGPNLMVTKLAVLRDE